MGLITIDDVNYESDLLSKEAKEVLHHLMQADAKLQEASTTVGLMRAATISLIDDLKTNHLTDEAIVTEE